MSHRHVTLFSGYDKAHGKFVSRKKLKLRLYNSTDHYTKDHIYLTLMKRPFACSKYHVWCGLHLCYTRKSSKNWPMCNFDYSLCSLFNISANTVQDGRFWDCSQLRRWVFLPNYVPKICHTFPTVTKTSTVHHSCREIKLSLIPQPHRLLGFSWC